jgi:hypothetical protein
MCVSIAQAQTDTDLIIERDFFSSQGELLSQGMDSLTLIIAAQNQEIILQKQAINELNQEIVALKQQYAADSLSLAERIEDMEDEKLSLEQLNDTLQKINEEFRTQLNDKNRLLEEKIKILQQKEILFAEKEQVYKDAISTSNVDRAKIEGLLNAKNESIAGKEKEIAYLAKNINDKEKDISNKDKQLSLAMSEKDKYSQMTDTLREKLVTAEKELLKINEELKYTKKRADEAEAKIAQATSRKKKVRVIQGISMRFYPIPEWDIMPFRGDDGALHNKIINRNDGFVEFDFITGASVMLFDFTKKDARFSHDLGLYVGFGGQNLFKNFYFGANYKFLDFFHLTVGVNVAQYQLLADDYKVGMQLPDGFAMQFKKQWKVTPFISLSLDLEFLSYIGKK